MRYPLWVMGGFFSLTACNRGHDAVFSDLEKKAQAKKEYYEGILDGHRVRVPSRSIRLSSSENIQTADGGRDRLIHEFVLKTTIDELMGSVDIDEKYKEVDIAVQSRDYFNITPEAINRMASRCIDGSWAGRPKEYISDGNLKFGLNWCTIKPFINDKNPKNHYYYDMYNNKQVKSFIECPGFKYQISRCSHYFFLPGNFHPLIVIIYNRDFFLKDWKAIEDEVAQKILNFEVIKEN